jgi:branched-chain amino acid transport system ATP-binding protein
MLELKNLVVGYGRQKTVLHDVNLTFPDGQMAVVMGHNGAGKTTLLNAIFGLLSPDRGEILADGQPLRSGPEERVRRRMAYSPAGQAVFPGLSVGENLDIAAAVTTTTAHAVRQRKQAVFGMFPVLAERLRVRAGALSGGQRRMLALGMTLMQDPQVLLLDEPSLGLSPLMVEELYGAITRIRDEFGLTVIAVEQSINPTILQADKLHILRMGRVVLSGESDILSDPQRLWTLL